MKGYIRSVVCIFGDLWCQKDIQLKWFQCIMPKVYQEVQALDGVFLATSKDIDWREDLFDNWHYYDIAQSFEFQRQGYKVVIPKPRMPWVLHNDKWGRILGNDYFQATKRFLQEYMEDLL